MRPFFRIAGALIAIAFLFATNAPLMSNSHIEGHHGTVAGPADMSSSEKHHERHSDHDQGLCMIVCTAPLLDIANGVISSALFVQADYFASDVRPATFIEDSPKKPPRV